MKIFGQEAHTPLKARDAILCFTGGGFNIILGKAVFIKAFLPFEYSSLFISYSTLASNTNCAIIGNFLFHFSHLTSVYCNCLRSDFMGIPFLGRFLLKDVCHKITSLETI